MAMQATRVLMLGLAFIYPHPRRLKLFHYIVPGYLNRWQRLDCCCRPGPDLKDQSPVIAIVSAPGNLGLSTETRSLIVPAMPLRLSKSILDGGRIEKVLEQRDLRESFVVHTAGWK
ncbi:hypothetical protein BDD12DRAFT_371727 [Trichophaea hybrida]|nr:hypothetical protein BDD12DRAFT_371727 [Trichophaea hybrida]